MLQPGKYALLKVARKVDFGLFLTDGENEVLLPRKWVTPEMEILSEVKVFIYKDSEDRTIATTQVPYAIAGEFAFLQVREVNAFGAFLDWGLDKDLLVPFREQDKALEVGKSYVVYVYTDKLTKRMVASSKINRYTSNEQIDLTENEEVDVLIAKKTELGYNVIINNLHQGLVYKNEIFQPLALGDRIKGYIKTIRQDGKIDIRLQKSGLDSTLDAQDRLIAKLKEANGFLPLNDASDPALISKTLGISKKSFKKAVGGLYKLKLIRIEEQGIRLV